MRLPVIYIGTHDSIGLGEDGPTHQPVEHLAMLRAIPNVVLLRPADATETVEAWRVAMARHDGPTMLVLSRQKLPILDREALGKAEGVARGRVRAARSARRQPAGDPHRHRQRGPCRPRRGQAAPGGPGEGAGGLDALVGALRGPARELPARGAAALGPRAARHRGRVPVRVAPLDHRRRRRARDGRLRRLGARATDSSRSSSSPRSTRPRWCARSWHGGRHDVQPAGSPGRAGPEPVVRLHHPGPGDLGRAPAAHRRRRPPGHDVQPDHLREGRLHQPALRRRDPAAGRAGPERGRDLRDAGGRRRARGVRRVRRAARGDRWDRRAGLAGGLAHPRRRHRGDHPRGRAAVGGGGPAQRHDQDPGHRGGPAGDHALHRRRDQRQRHPALLGRALRQGDRGLARGMERRLRRGLPLAPGGLGRELLREPGGRQGGSGAGSAGRVGRHPGVAAARPDRDRQCLRGLPAVRVVAGHPAVGPAGQGRGPASAAAVGVHQHQGSRATRTSTTSRRWWRPAR